MSGGFELHAVVGQVDGDGGEAVHQAMTKAGSLPIVVSPTERQSGEFVRKAAGFWPALKIDL